MIPFTNAVDIIMSTSQSISTEKELEFDFYAQKLAVIIIERESIAVVICSILEAHTVHEHDILKKGTLGW